MPSRSRRALALWRAQRELSRELAALSRDQASACGLSAAQGEALLLLAEHDRLPMQELSERLGIAPSSATRLVQQMVRDGLVVREDDPDDRRRVTVRALETGLDLADQLASVGFSDAWDYDRWIEGAADAPADWQEAARTLREWARARRETTD